MIVPSLVGQPCGCPRCQFQFLMPAAPPPPPPQPQQAPIVSVYRSTVAQRFQPAKSIFDVFDFKFEKYVTPIIIRATWVLALVSAGLFAAWGCYNVVDPVTENRYEVQLPGFMQPSNGETGAADAEPNSKLISATKAKAAKERALLIAKIMAYCFQLVSICLALLWLRVALEMTVVIFNIATSVHSIDRKTKG